MRGTGGMRGTRRMGWIDRDGGRLRWPWKGGLMIDIDEKREPITHTDSHLQAL